MSQWNPLHDLVNLQNRMNRLFEDATQRGAADADAGDAIERADWYPAADVFEETGSYVVAIDLPGIDRDKLDISVDDNRLIVRGERNARNATSHRREIPNGKFIRSFSVPASVEQNNIRANYKDGVLEIRLPKQAEPKTARVQIKIS